jgi:hypothetical protein
LGHLAKGAQLANRAAKLVGPLAQFGEQSRIFYGNDSLRSEILDQFDLHVGEVTNFLPEDDDRAARSAKGGGHLQSAAIGTPDGHQIGFAETGSGFGQRVQYCL